MGYRRRLQHQPYLAECRNCGQLWEYTAARSHGCDPEAKLAHAIETRRPDLLRWAVAYLEAEMRRVMRAAGIRHRNWREGQPDPNEWTRDPGWTGERVRQLGRQWYAVLRAAWEHC